MNLTVKEEVAAVIDHTLLKPDAKRGDVAHLCEEARSARFASVCINPCWVPVAVAELRDSRVKVCTVVGFPLGASRAAAKVAEAKLALLDGARELDMVLNIGALRSGDYDAAGEEIAALSDLVHASGAVLKVILETCLLSDEEKRRACRLAVDAKADFVKTSTGFSTSGATVEDVALMRHEVGPSVGVKASGGVRTLATLAAMLEAGATRIGTSSGIAILREAGEQRPVPLDGQDLDQQDVGAY